MGDTDTLYLGPVGLADAGQAVHADLNLDSYEPLVHPGHLILGPSNLHYREMLIRNEQPLLQQYARTSICYFLGPGEDLADRRSTRIGGLPFWPKCREWPRDEFAQPIPFLAQLDFRHIQWPEALPGEILTIHCIDDNLQPFIGRGDSDIIRMTWHRNVPEHELITAECWKENYTGLGTPGPYYGEPCLVNDYKLPWEEWHDIAETFHPFDLTVHGLKIGGHSPFCSSNGSEVLADIISPVFLCALASVFGEPTHFLPPKPEAAGLSIQPLDFGSFATLVIVYPRGNPGELYWIVYLP